MGDRANVYIHEGDLPGVYIYTHWYGSDLPELITAIMETPEAKSRKNDAPSLTRIIIEQLLVMTESIGGSTGWGVSAQVGDGGDRIVDIDVQHFGANVTTYGYGKLDDYEDEYYDIDDHLVYGIN